MTHEWYFDAVPFAGHALDKLESLEAEGWEIFAVQRIDAGYWIVYRRPKAEGSTK